ncbi:MAG: phosphatidate cytidylyltransferase [Hyphomicrobium sp.]|jgi:phosphatidate cytidylyltransferase|nr:phosphatidate cytidylyltransferase [Hyphomicrobium sp.]
MSETPGDPSSTAARAPGPAANELVLRIGSGLVLAVVAGGLVYAGGPAFAVFVAAIGGLTSLEWSRIVRGPGFDAGLGIQIVAVAVASALAAAGLAALGLSALAVGTILTGLLCFSSRPLLSAEGVIYAGLPAVALIWLRDDPGFGLQAVLFILVSVVATDVLAFVCGRLIGGPKLAPAISPNKTWSGFLGGISAAGLAGAAFAAAIGADPVRLGLAGLVLGIVSQIGDLTESALKRSFGVKDSGTLIPGHGGIMDRIDGLVFAAAAAGFVALAINPHSPARALLFGG